MIFWISQVAIYFHSKYKVNPFNADSLTLSYISYLLIEAVTSQDIDDVNLS